MKIILIIIVLILSKNVYANNTIAQSYNMDEYIGSLNDVVKKEEGIRILKQVKDNEYMILLDLHGKEIDSVEFSKIIDMTSIKFSTITFVIGGSLGLSDAVIQRANYRLCLSKMTFTHQMTRIILLEQVYRSFKILKNETYHK